MSRLKQLTEGAAVVTGAAGGIGRAIGSCAAELGFAVTLVDVMAEPINALAASLRDSGSDATAAIADVRDAEAMQELASEVRARSGPVSLLVNNAGIETTGRLWEILPERWAQIMAVNVTGVYNGVKAFVPQMIAEGISAHIVNVASIGSVSIGPYQTPYLTSKHAVLTMTECLMSELAADDIHHITVSAVLPGPVRTAIFRSAQSSDTDGPGAAQLRDMTRLLESGGMDPVEVAAIGFDGIERGDRYIHTHPELSQAAITARMNQLLTSWPVTLP